MMNLDLQLLEISDAFLDARHPHRFQGLPFLFCRLTVGRKQGQLPGNFLKREASTLRQCDVVDPLQR